MTTPKTILKIKQVIPNMQAEDHRQRWNKLQLCLTSEVAQEPGGLVPGCLLHLTYNCNIVKGLENF